MDFVCPRLLMIHTGNFHWTRERRQIVSPERGSRSQACGSYKRETGMDSLSGSSSVSLIFVTQGHTKTLNFYRVGKEPGKITLVDTPGYGARGRPEWGELFDHYINNRKE